jgi:hypothetical protein
MSVTSRKLKALELPDLHNAQVSAASIPDYFLWRDWMRSRYHYAAVVRMAVYLGFKIPGRGFYHRMRRCGQRRIKHA